MEDIPTPSPRASARPALGSLTMLWGFAKRYPGRIAGALIALIVSSVLSTILLLFNYTDGLIAAFTFLIAISTLGTVSAYTLSACADLKFSWKRARVWAALAMIAIAYSIVAMLGSGVKSLLWGAVLMALGLPIYFWTKRQRAKAILA